MGLFDKIMGALFEEVPGSPSAGGAVGPAGAGKTGGGPIGKGANTIVSQKGQASASPAPSSAAGPGVPASGAQPAAVDAAVEQKFIESLQRAMETENLPGFDLYEFHQLYKKFLASGKSEADAMKAAILSSETMRVEKNTLIANYSHYAQVLQGQSKAFEADLNGFFKKNIAGPKKESDDIDTEIAKKTGLIAQYTQDIEDLKQRKIDLGVDVQKAEEQIQKVRAAFQKAFDEVSHELSSLHERLKSL